MPTYTRTFRSKKLHPEHVKLLNEAIRKNAKGGDHNLHISYTKADGSKSDRKVKPLAVKGKSLFVAHCHKRNAIRSFKVERIDMIKQAFWDGFEKRAYDYKYEVKKREEEARYRSKQKPMDMKKSVLTGAALGGLGGALYGGIKDRSLGGAALGGLLGAASLGLGAAGIALADAVGIAEAKRIVKMPDKERREYLAYLARQGEISEQQSREWSRDFANRMDSNIKHRETINTLKDLRREGRHD